jgi:hypothetical protein
MRTRLLIITIITLNVSFGQKTKTFDQIRQDLNNAKFSKQIKQNKTIFFSNSTKQDTIVLIVDTGLIYKSKSHLRIKTCDNHIIFSETFNTSFFSRGVFEPDTTPQGGQKVYEKFIERYVKSTSKTKIEKYTQANVQAFLNDIEVNKIELEKFKDDAADKQFFKQVMKDKSSYVIWFPCFECDEGVRYFVYSKIKKKAIKFLETD